MSRDDQFKVFFPTLSGQDSAQLPKVKTWPIDWFPYVMKFRNYKYSIHFNNFESNCPVPFKYDHTLRDIFTKICINDNNGLYEGNSQKDLILKMQWHSAFHRDIARFFEKVYY